MDNLDKLIFFSSKQYLKNLKVAKRFRNENNIPLEIKYKEIASIHLDYFLKFSKCKDNQ